MQPRRAFLIPEDEMCFLSWLLCKTNVLFLSLAPPESAQPQPHSSRRVHCFLFFSFVFCDVSYRSGSPEHFFFFLMHSPHAKGCNKGKSTTFLEQETSWTLFPSDILNSLWGLWNKHTTALEQDSQGCHNWDQAVWTLEMSSMLYSPERCQERCGFLVLPTRIQLCLLQVLTL